MSTLSFSYPSIPDYANPELEAAVTARLDDLTKPQGSLGRLEEIALRFMMCRGSHAAKLDRMQLRTFAADHGIATRGITPFPQEVTAQMVLNMLRGGAAVSVMCRNAGIGYSVVDMGVVTDLPDHELLIKRKVVPGTADFCNGNAMTADQCETALKTGIRLASESGADLLGIGEMGIANSAAAAALYSLFLGLDGTETTGSGTGAHGPLLERKRECIHNAVEYHREGWDGTAPDALRRCGGFEIAAMTGYMLGAAAGRIPVVVDGFICGAAALAAMRIDPGIRNYLFFSHISAERFHREFLRKENIIPLLDLGMRLGEGTGSVLAMQIIQQAINCYHHMATFSSASVSREK